MEPLVPSDILTPAPKVNGAVTGSLNVSSHFFD